MYGSSLPCSLQTFHTLLKAFFEVNGCDPKRLVPFGGSLSKLLQREKVVFCGEARSEACLVSGQVGVQREL